MYLADLTNSENNTESYLFDNTTDTSLVLPTPSYSYDKLNEYTDKSRKKITAETHSRKFCALDDKASVVIQDKSESNPYLKDKLISNISVDNNAQMFETSKKYNYSVNTPGAHILLGCDDAQ